MLKIDGYDIYFRHKPNEEGTIMVKTDERVTESPFKGMTECIIEKDKNEVAIGVACCSLSDRYVKSVGRKVALARAIEEFDKDFRKAVWEAYIKETSRL